MAGAVVEVKSPLPCRDPCQYVQVITCGTFQEHGARQMQVAQEDGGEIILHAVGYVPKGKGPCDVCGAFHVAAAGIG